MLWNFLLAVVLIGFTVWLVCITRSNLRDKFDLYAPLGFFAFFIVVPVVVASLIGTGSNQMEYSKYKHSTELVTMKREQRDELSVIVKDALSTEQYTALMAATPDANILVILGSGVADVMVERSRTLVALNADLNGLVNQLARDRINLCSWADNSLTPRLFVSPRCPAPISLGAK